MKNKLVLDEIKSQGGKDSLTRILSREVPLDVVDESRRGLRIFPHLRVRREGYGGLKYKLIPLFGENCKLRKNVDSLPEVVKWHSSEVFIYQRIGTSGEQGIYIFCLVPREEAVSH